MKTKAAEGVATSTTERYVLRLLLLFLFLALCISLGGYLYYDLQKAAIKKQVYRNLMAIRDLKVDQIVSWRKERLADATFIFENPLVASRFAEFLRRKDDPSLRRELLFWMRSFLRNFSYGSVVFVDTAGERLLEAGSHGGHAKHARSLAAKALREGRVIFNDFHAEESMGSVHLDISIPLRGSPDKGSTPHGVLVLGIDPHQFLYPLVNTWPMPSNTAETLLIRREGDNVVFLNELRHKKGAALRLRFPVHTEHLAAARVVRGETGVIEAVDYRGVPVLAAVAPVPASPWFIVSKVDTEEIFAPIRRRAWFISFIVASLILASAFGVSTIWRRKREEHYRNLYEAQLSHQALAERFDYLTKYANDIIILANNDGRIIEANDRAVSTYGYSQKELQAMNLLDLRIPDAAPLLSRQMREAEEHNGIVFETVHRRKDGSIFPVETSARVIRMSEGVYYQSIIRDISERKEAEKRLTHANRLYAVLSHINQTIVKGDSRARLLDEICRISVEHGRFRIAWISMVDEEKGCLHTVAVHGDDEGYIEAIAATKGGEPLGRDPTGTAIGDARQVVCNDIRTDPLMEPWRERALSRGFRSVAAFPLFAGGRVAGSLTLCSEEAQFFSADEIRLLQEVTADISFALDHMEKERERQRLEAQLLQSQRMEAVGQLAGGIAHDFNNILTAIIGYGNLLLMKMAGDDPGRIHVGHILEASDKAAQLARRLLAFSRKQIINPVPVDLNDVIRNVGNLLARIIGEDIELKIALTDEPLTVMADIGQIEQVLMNLCTNARDAMPEGGLLAIESGRTHMDTHFTSTHGFGTAGDFALLTVTDSGPGMDEETRVRIFEPFFSTKEVGKGTGLGLSIVYGIVKQHRGYIDVYTDPGKGTTFKIYLPLAGLEAEKRVLPTFSQGALPRGSERILLAEDDPAVRQLNRSVLKDFGYAIIEAADGEEAIARFKEEGGTVDLLILDVVMPKRNGKEVLDEIRKTHQATKAIFMSGYTANVIHRKGILEQDVDFLMKPVSLGDLLRKIREVLDRPG